MTTGEKIKKTRLLRGLTQQELSRQTGIGVRLIQKYEADERFPKEDNIKKITDTLQMSPHALTNHHIECVEDAMFAIFEIEQKFGPLSITLENGFCKLLFPEGDLYNYIRSWRDATRYIDADSAFEWKMSLPPVKDITYYKNLPFNRDDFEEWASSVPVPSGNADTITYWGICVEKSAFERWLLELSILRVRKHIFNSIPERYQQELRMKALNCSPPIEPWLVDDSIFEDCNVDSIEQFLEKEHSRSYAFDWFG